MDSIGEITKMKSRWKLLPNFCSACNKAWKYIHQRNIYGY